AGDLSAGLLRQFADSRLKSRQDLGSGGRFWKQVDVIGRKRDHLRQHLVILNLFAFHTISFHLIYSWKWFSDLSFPVLELRSGCMVLRNATGHRPKKSGSCFFNEMRCGSQKKGTDPSFAGTDPSLFASEKPNVLRIFSRTRGKTFLRA